MTTLYNEVYSFLNDINTRALERIIDPCIDNLERYNTVLLNPVDFSILVSEIRQIAYSDQDSNLLFRMDDVIFSVNEKEHTLSVVH